MLKPRGPLRIVGVVMTLALAVLASAGAPAVAGSGTTDYGTLKVSDKVTNGTRCVTETIEFVPTSALFDWTLRVDVDNTTSALTFPSFTLDAAHRTRAMVLCPGKQPAGDYRLDGYLQGNKEPSSEGACCSISRGVQASFSFRVIDRKPTAISVAVTRSHDASRCPLRQTRHCSKMTGRMTRAGKPWKWEYVRLEAYQRGRWALVSNGRTDGLGRAIWYVTITQKERRLKFRMRFKTQDYAQGSVSRTFRALY